MLRDALKSGLSVVGVFTTDPLHATEIIGYEWGDPKSVKVLTPLTAGVPGINVVQAIMQDLKKIKGGVGVLYPAKGFTQYEALRAEVIKENQTESILTCKLVIVNPSEEALPYMFNAGMMELPPDVLRKWVQLFAKPSAVTKIVQALRGLTFKQAKDVCHIATANNQPFNATSVLNARRRLYHEAKGIELVSTDFSKVFYLPDEDIEHWLLIDGELFKSNEHPLLTPRGLMFDGEPGTGKTMGAKYIASQLEVPLYLLNMGSVLDKYVGESEKNIVSALKAAESCAPCVLLLDEVDKLFSTSNDQGATQRTLSGLLWWLQEHESQVLTIMTSNDIEKVPAELFRPGRIDTTFQFYGTGATYAPTFIAALHDWWCARLNTSIEPPDLTDNGWLPAAISEADLTQRYLQWLKGQLVNGSTKGVKP